MSKVDLKLDVYLDVTGELVFSFHDPSHVLDASWEIEDGIVARRETYGGADEIDGYHERWIEITLAEFEQELRELHRKLKERVE